MFAYLHTQRTYKTFPKWSHKANAPYQMGPAFPGIGPSQTSKMLNCQEEDLSELVLPGYIRMEATDFINGEDLAQEIEHGFDLFMTTPIAPHR